jgi:dTDP-4-dehydrorhamnose 3,5-epimerase
MEIKPLIMPGCLRLYPQVITDIRGNFIKTFVNEEFVNFGLPTNYKEEYYSHSKAGVLRGLHFQLPPFEYSKLVSCIYGKMTDVIFDLRIGSPMYGQAETIEMNSLTGQILYLPPGIAHGFLAHTDVVVSYKVTSSYSPQFDTGIRWDSIAVDWGKNNPVLSARDQLLPAWHEFVTPFVYKLTEEL